MTKGAGDHEEKPSPGRQAFLIISGAPHSTAAASETLRLLGRAIGDPALARAADRLAGDRGDGPSPREAAAAAYAARKDEMLAEVARLEQLGRGKTAVGLVARAFAADGGRDPVERESLERALRRWRKISGHCP